VHIRNLSQRNAFTVYIRANDVHDLRLPMSHGSSRTPSLARLSQP
jgi:hypothetical protein